MFKNAIILFAKATLPTSIAEIFFLLVQLLKKIFCPIAFINIYVSMLLLEFKKNAFFSKKSIFPKTFQYLANLQKR